MQHEYLTTINKIYNSKLNNYAHNERDRRHRRSDQRHAPPVWLHRDGLLPRGRHHREELLPTDAQKKSTPSTHARVLALLRRLLTEEEYTALCREYVEAIVEDYL